MMDQEELKRILESFNLTNDDNFTLPSSTYDLKYERELLMYYMMGIGGMTLCSLGIIGNILSIIVLTRRVMRSSTYSYLTALAVSDTFFLFFTMLLCLRDTRKPRPNELRWVEPYYVYMFPYVHPLAVTTQITSIWLTLAFTVDRYIMICHPFKAERWCSINRARKVIVALSVAGILFNVVRFLEYTTCVVDKSANTSIEVDIPKFTITNITTSSTMPNVFTSSVSNTNMESVVIDLTDLGKSDEFRMIVHSWLYLTCVAGIPFISLLVLNTFLIHAVHQSRKKGREINAKEKRRNDTTLMLIGVIVIFLFCQGPALISRMIWAFQFNKFKNSGSLNTFNEVSNFLVILNSAINIVPYYFFGKKFRKQFWRLFCKCILSKDELRRLTRSLSLSIDRRQSHPGENYELNHLEAFQHSDAYKKFLHKYSIAIPLMDDMQDPSPTREENENFVDIYQNGDNSKNDVQKKLRVQFESNGNCEVKVDTCDEFQYKVIL